MKALIVAAGILASTFAASVANAGPMGAPVPAEKTATSAVVQVAYPCGRGWHLVRGVCRPYHAPVRHYWHRPPPPPWAYHRGWHGHRPPPPPPHHWHHR